MVPLGQREDLRLEFKRVEVLDEPANVAREAAAMLNAEGGAIWIGIEESGGVASRATQIPDVESQRRKLQDVLIDRLEPSPTQEEVQVVVSDGLLVVKVTQGKRGPYAYLERSMRGFVIRVGDRTRALALDELKERFADKQSTVDEGEAAIERLRGPARKPKDGAVDGLFVYFAALPALAIDLGSQALKDLLRNPESSHNRRLGWNFSSEFHGLKPKGGKATWSADHESHQLELRKTGELTFAVPLRRLNWKGEANEIYPFALIEYVLSVFRLYPAIVEKCSTTAPRHAWVALSLRGVESWTLRPHSPNSIGYVTTAGASPDGDIELNPIRLEWDELTRAPDRCGWRLLELVYDHFGYGSSEMPAEFNKQSERFVLTN